MSELVAQFEKQYPNGATIWGDIRQPASSFSVTVLFGASGSGKTTVLRCLAGLERPSSGCIRFVDDKWYDARDRVFLGPQARGIGFMFQDYALFPHLTVARNIAYGLHRLSSAERRERVAELLERFQLAGLGNRFPHQVSGGQQQRVALARAVARRPRLLLLDEPLSALDAALRDEMRTQLRRQLADLEIPVILVTHDRTEAIALGDRLVVMDEGRVRQSGTVQEVFSQPADVNVARITGVETVQPGRITAVDDGLASVDVSGVVLTAVAPRSVSQKVHVCIRGEDVMLERRRAGESSARNQLTATVTSMAPEGPLIRVGLDCGFALTALVTRPACAELQLSVGERLTALIKAPAIHLVPSE